MTTANDVCSDALRVISTLGVGEPIPGEDADQALAALNAMLAAFSADGFKFPYRTLEQFTLTVGQASYTIGTGANLNTQRPDSVTDAYARDASGLDWPLDAAMTKEEYNALPLKSISGRPMRLYYDTQYPSGVIYLDRAPDAAYTLFLESQKPFAQFTTIQGTVQLPGEYRQPLTYLLAEHLAPRYGFPITPDVRKLISDAERRLGRRNAKMKVAKFDAALRRPGAGDRGWFS